MHADSALVVAPHYDDEVLGCGGLLVRLAETGAEVRVLFLTDSGRAEVGRTEGGEGAGDRDAYGERRRREASEAAKVLGLAGIDHLGLPDGELHRHLGAAERGIRSALLSQRPDLLLVPSPLEVTPDHRAAFHALHRVLAPVREGPSRGSATDAGTNCETDAESDALRDATTSCRVLVYEINQPAYPDLLVDVTAQVPRLEEAMGRYTSQQERHDYLAAALGLRRFRTLTLPAAEGGTTAAEGYRGLTVADFTTRSPAQLVRHLGGSPELLEITEGPTLSVVVRTRDRPELLAQALGSLAGGSYRRVQVVLVNDGGERPEIPDGYPFPVERIDLPENRGRAEAANAGVAAATGDWIAFLDDDDLAAPEHLATLADASAGAGVRVVYTDAAVAIYELAGGDGEGGWVCRERRLPYSRDFDPERLLLDNYIPFNTLLIERTLFDETALDGRHFDPELPFFEDWDFLIRLSRRVPFLHLPRVTCEYRHFRGGGHHVLGEQPRRRSDFLEMKARVLAKHASFLEPELLARAVDSLKTELVEAREEARTSAEARRERERELRALGADHHRLSGELHALEASYHRLNGELHSVRDDAARKGRELDRLYEEERKLRAVVGDQDEHLKRTYGEIERLQGVIREMESTRAWRIHRRLTGGRGRQDS